MADLGQALQQQFVTGRRDAGRGRVELADTVGDRTNGAGAAERACPAAAQEHRLDRLQLQPRRQPRAFDAFGRQPPVTEEALAQRHATDLHALQFQRLEALADDDLGAAAADVDHQPALIFIRQIVRHARIDQARLFHAGDDFDGETQCLARPLEERLLAARNAQRVGTHDPHVAGVHVAQALAEAFQAGQRARRDLFIEPAIIADTCGQPYHLTQAVDDDQLAVRVARDHHVKAVGSEVYRRDDFVGGGAPPAHGEASRRERIRR